MIPNIGTQELCRALGREEYEFDLHAMADHLNEENGVRKAALVVGDLSEDPVDQKTPFWAVRLEDGLLEGEDDFRWEVLKSEVERHDISKLSPSEFVQ